MYHDQYNIICQLFRFWMYEIDPKLVQKSP